MMTATSRISMTEIVDRCGHGAENCITHGPFRSSIRLAQHFILIQDTKLQASGKPSWDTVDPVGAALLQSQSRDAALQSVAAAVNCPNLVSLPQCDGQYAGYGRSPFTIKRTRGAEIMHKHESDFSAGYRCG